MRARAGNWLAALAFACACGLGAAHELPANRLTLIQRESGHLSLVFYIDYAQALHRLLAPQQDFQAFALTHAAMEPNTWGLILRRAQARLEAETSILLIDGRRLPITHWRWLDTHRTQALLREHAMRAIVAPGEHTHEAPTEILAEVVAAEAIGEILLRLPDALQAVLVVSYRPKQAWVKPGAAALSIKF